MPLTPAACSTFLSTHSVRSATGASFVRWLPLSISIHALRKECDSLKGNAAMIYFQKPLFRELIFFYIIFPIPFKQNNF